MNKSSCLAPALGVTKFITVTDKFWSHFVVIIKSHLEIQQIPLHCGGFVEHQSLTSGAQQSVTKVISANFMNLVTLKAGTGMIFCPTNWTLRWVYWASKSDLSSTTKCEQNRVFDQYEFGTPKPGTKHELLFNEQSTENQQNNDNSMSKELEEVDPDLILFNYGRVFTKVITQKPAIMWVLKAHQKHTSI